MTTLSNLCAIDFETHLIGPGAIFPKPVCLSTYNGTEAALLGKDKIEEGLKQILTFNIMIAHNATFECGVIYYHYPELRPLLFAAVKEGRVVCTKMQEELINIIRPKGAYKFSLSDLVKYYFETDISATKTGADAWRLRYSELEDIPVDRWPAAARDYAIDDSIWAHKVYMKQREGTYKIDKESNQLAIESSVYLNIMASKGMELDLSKVAELKRELMAYLKPNHDFLIEQGFCVKNPKYEMPQKKIKKLKEYIETLDVEYMYTTKGGVCVSGEALEYYNNQVEDKILQTFSAISKHEKALTAFVARMQETPIYSQYATAKNTGRTSSSGSKLFPSLNIQQMPRSIEGVTHDVRNCFIPKPGFKILSIDYGGLELCATAHQLYKVFGRSKMRDVLNEGTEPTDMHSRLAARLKNMSYEDFIDRKKELKDVRQLAKPINLGFPGGIGYDSMRKILWQSGIKTKFQVLHKAQRKGELRSLMLSLAAPDVRICRLTKNEYALVQDELVYLKRQFFDLYPELETFLKETHLKYTTGHVKKVKNEFGEWEDEPMYKYKVFGFERDWCTYTAFCNGFLMQSPSAVGAKKAVVAICSKYMDHPDVQPLAFIHDEILFQIRESRIANDKELVVDICNIMIEEMQKVLSSVRITVEASLMDYWQKGDGFWTEKFWRDPVGAVK